jgi:hypothetical protein
MPTNSKTKSSTDDDWLGELLVGAVKLTRQHVVGVNAPIDIARVLGNAG